MADLQSLGLRPEKGLDPQIQEATAKDRLSLDRPIPGESLTNDPGSPYPFEKAPEYTDRTDALEYLFSTSNFSVFLLRSSIITLTLSFSSL